MRLRNVKNKEEIINNSPFLVSNPKQYKGKWKELFNNNNDIEIEIGTGKGKFIIEKAINNPDKNFIGIERFDSVIVRALEKIPNELTNLKMVRINAIELDEIFQKEIEKIYLNFSDPWPKKRHSNRRLTSKIFLQKYDNLFKNRKVIYQKTDNASLFEYSIVSLSEYGYKIKEISLDLHNSEIKKQPTTEYEDKFVKNGSKIYYLKCEK